MLKMYLSRYMPLYPMLGILGACAHAITASSYCTSSVYCTGELLQRVQLARIFPDSKTLVDLKLVYPENVTITNFDRLLNETKRNPTRDQLAAFVDKHFAEGNELEKWDPPDFNPEPPFLDRISDPKLKQFAKDVIGIWASLGRKIATDVAKNPDLYSFLYVPNGVIIPGGRFKELYYWDTYWMMRGLLISDMTQTARGVIENLLYLVDKLGYVPNGNRIYYLGRSQPPLLAAMVSSYFEATGDLEWLKKHVATVEKELQYWLHHKRVTVKLKGKNYMLLRYLPYKKINGPRPESYYEDYTNAQTLPTQEMREDFYREMKSAAESGWDFSSRWFVTEGKKTSNLTDVRASRILPVDLNAIFAGALEFMGDFRYVLNDKKEAQKWWSLAKQWRGAIEDVMWNAEDGVWYDYDFEARAPRRQFYPSCVSPLWTGAVEKYKAPQYAAKLVRYILSTGALEFPGGIPATMFDTGEQWDYPNAWPPLQSIFINGLASSGYGEAEELAREQAELWIRANYIGYYTWQRMFEKYSVLQPGQHGSGGEYVVQDGFGWTNGVLLELLNMYGKDLTFHDTDGLPSPIVRQV